MAAILLHTERMSNPPTSCMHAQIKAGSPEDVWLYNSVALNCGAVGKVTILTCLSDSPAVWSSPRTPVIPSGSSANSQLRREPLDAPGLRPRRPRPRTEAHVARPAAPPELEIDRATTILNGEHIGGNQVLKEVCPHALTAE